MNNLKKYNIEAFINPNGFPHLKNLNEADSFLCILGYFRNAFFVEKTILKSTKDIFENDKKGNAEWTYAIGVFIRIIDNKVMFGQYLDESLEGIPQFDPYIEDGEIVKGQIDLKQFIDITEHWLSFLKTHYKDSLLFVEQLELNIQDSLANQDQFSQFDILNKDNTKLYFRLSSQTNVVDNFIDYSVTKKKIFVVKEKNEERSEVVIDLQDKQLVENLFNFIGLPSNVEKSKLINDKLPILDAHDSNSNEELSIKTYGFYCSNPIPWSDIHGGIKSSGNTFVYLMFKKNFEFFRYTFTKGDLTFDQFIDNKSVKEVESNGSIFNGKYEINNDKIVLKYKIMKYKMELKYQLLPSGKLLDEENNEYEFIQNNKIA